MTMYATLEEAIDAAREEYLANNPSIEESDANIQQMNIQKVRASGWGHYVAGGIFRR